MRVARATRVFLVALVLSGCFGGSGAGAQTPTPELVDVSDNTWSLMSTGDVAAPQNITSYSGGWYDAANHQFCIFGGGHWDYSGNEVWCLDIASLTWHELYPPDVVTTPGGEQGAYENFDNQRYPGALFNPAGEPIASANPMSKHTYDQMEYVEGLGPVIWGGYSWGDSGTPWCQSCDDTWAFDFGAKRWNYLYDGSNPSPNFDAGVGASAFSSADGLLYVLSRGQTWTFDPKRNKWAEIRVGGTPPGSIESTIEYDSRRNRLYLFGGRYPDNKQLWQFDIKARRWSMLNPQGAAPAETAVYGPGLAFDSANDVLLVYSAGTVWAYHPDANRWETLQPANRPADADYVFGRFRYDPVNKGAWLHAWQDGHHVTWFYRYKR